MSERSEGTRTERRRAEVPARGPRARPQGQKLCRRPRVQPPCDARVRPLRFPAAVILYEVNLTVDLEVADVYAAWLGPHIDALLALEGFTGADWFDVDADPGAGRVRWCVQYRLRDRAALETYLAEHAARMRDEGLNRFAGRFEATRRVLVPRR